MSSSASVSKNAIKSFRITKLKRRKLESCLNSITGALNLGKSMLTASSQTDFAKRGRQLQLRRSIQSIFEDESHKWFKSRGMERLQTFSQEQLAQLKYIFRTLDHGGNSSLTADQIYEPFLSLGLVENHQQLDRMIVKLDQNNNKKIEFGEFMKIAKMGLEDKTTSKIKNFFENLLHNQKQKPFRHSFTLFFSKKRRDTLMQGLRATLHEDTTNRQELLNKMKRFKSLDVQTP